MTDYEIRLLMSFLIFVSVILAYYGITIYSFPGGGHVDP